MKHCCLDDLHKREEVADQNAKEAVGLHPSFQTMVLRHISGNLFTSTQSVVNMSLCLK